MEIILCQMWDAIWRFGMMIGGGVDMDKVLNESLVLTSEEVMQWRTQWLEHLIKVYIIQYMKLMASITLFRAISVLCGTNNIMQNICHI